MAGVNVKSEIKPLKRVLLHRPGNELLNLTPNTLEELLFDDIPFLKVAQEEHDAFAQALRDNGVEVVYLEDLMTEVLDQNPDVRETFLKQFIEEAGIRTDRYQKIIFDYLNDNYPENKDLVLKTMEGINLTELHTDKSNSLVDLVSEASKMVVAPMPNLYFTRDNFAMIGNGVSINRMYSVTRNRETIYGEYIFKYHPDFKDVPQYYSRYNTFHIEGGDILNINDHVLAVGISQRTEPDAIDALAHNIFNDETSPIDTILAFNIPNNRAMMHLDTVFTQIDTDKFTIHPGIMGPLTVFEITPEGEGIKVKEMTGKLEDILEKYVGMPVELIPCGGGDRIAAEREQWNDGSNTLCIAPGTVCVYERNDVTNKVLEEKGIKLIVIPSAELSRGRGGPRCMSMPIWRED
ncbi:MULTISPECIES: arginine deiminase [Gordonibacter]|uniref:Arginine deiminase n=3 Tax=Gordonibacter TaxID=644652 RepID=A0A6N8IJY5_9ACTN|nr:MULTISPECIES: arginine deiminase [Gordonibacter]GKG90153.1 arginine deiminase [Gordonibacter pamelaeae]MCB7085895.1 arginine deiminase [Gordonibacter urolithinfaciens]MDN4470258.1 arginine deiminase [Gordonibacter sp. RACS_AR68]MDN4509823.1 arginine deiminase [Gordonibacter sp. RACS_AR49]MSA93717.1 arginine deiminase [Gordonibacter urolithinfaciens]